MPAISEMEYGYSMLGVEDYIEQLRVVVLEEAAKEIRTIDSIKTVCDQEWEGKSKEIFIKNFQDSANHVSDQLQNLFNILTREIDSVRDAMSLRDQNIFTEE